MGPPISHDREMQKRAFLGQAAKAGWDMLTALPRLAVGADRAVTRGVASNVIGRPVMGIGRALGGAASSGVMGVLGSAGGVLRRAAENQPLGTIMTVGMGVPMVASLSSGLVKDPENLARAYESGNLIQQGFDQSRSGMMKLNSSVLSQADFDQALRIRGQLEKVASKSVPARPTWGPKQLMQAAALVGAVGAGVGLAQQAGARAAGVLEEKLRAGKRKERYEAMLKADPSLREDPMAKTYFAILDRASPYMSSEPHIAAATVQTMLETPPLREGGVPAIGAKQIQEILRTEEARQGTRFPLLHTKQPRGPEVKDLSSFGLGS